MHLREIDGSFSFNWSFSLVFFVIAVLGKFSGVFLIRESGPMRLVTGLSMVPRGEVGLIFAEVGRVTEIFKNEVYGAMVIVIALTTLLPPLIMKWIYIRFGEP